MAATHFTIPDGTPGDEYPDVPAGPGEPTYAISWSDGPPERAGDDNCLFATARLVAVCACLVMVVLKLGGSVWSGRTSVDALYKQAQHESARAPIWDALRAEQAAALPTCVNHPGRATVGGFGDEFYCHECVGAEIARRRMYMKSQSLIVGGVEGFR